MRFYRSCFAFLEMMRVVIWGKVEYRAVLWQADWRILGAGGTFSIHSFMFWRTLTFTLTPVFLQPQKRAELHAEVLEGCASGGLHPNAMQWDHPSWHTPPLFLGPQWDLSSGNLQLGWRDKPQTEVCCKGLHTAGKALSKIFDWNGKGKMPASSTGKLDLIWCVEEKVVDASFSQALRYT